MALNTWQLFSSAIYWYLHIHGMLFAENTENETNIAQHTATLSRQFY